MCFNFVHDYMVTPHFSDDELGNKSILCSCKYTKLQLQMKQF